MRRIAFYPKRQNQIYCLDFLGWYKHRSQYEADYLWIGIDRGDFVAGEKPRL